MKKVKCCDLLNLPEFRRWIICLVLGGVFGFICAYGRLMTTPELWAMEHYWWSAVMWGFVINRVLIGVMLFFAGGFLWCPWSGIRFFPWMRGALIGGIVSLDVSVGVLAQRGDWDGFLEILIAGILYGVIIDVLATRFGGEGEELLDSCCPREKKGWFWRK